MKGRELHWEDTGLGRSLYVQNIEALPFEHEDKSAFNKFYKVVSYGGSTPIMYLVKGNPDAPKEVCGFYPNGKFWGGFSLNFKGAVVGMFKDAIYYIEKH